MSDNNFKCSSLKYDSNASKNWKMKYNEPKNKHFFAVHSLFSFQLTNIKHFTSPCELETAFANSGIENSYYWKSKGT